MISEFLIYLQERSEVAKLFADLDLCCTDHLNPKFYWFYIAFCIYTHLHIIHIYKHLLFYIVICNIKAANINISRLTYHNQNIRVLT